MTRHAATALLLSAAAPVAAERVIDMHLHAYPADAFGPQPLSVCAPYADFPPIAGKVTADNYAAEAFGHPSCAHPVRGAASDDELRTRSLAALAKDDVLAVASGPPALVERWRAAAPARILPGVEINFDAPPSIESLRALHKAGRLKVMGEFEPQYAGLAPADPKLEPYWVLAEELDVPVGIHMGPGPPGAPYAGSPAYRMALSDPLLLEPVLAKHPKLRVYVMHAGWPMADRMIALMYAWPQVYADVGVIDWTQPRAEFWSYLKRLVDAGYGKRVMFGSDQMVWPDAIPAAIDAIRSAPGLTAAQKQDILHDNAARFLNLDVARR